MGRGTMHTVQKVNLEGIRCNIMCRSLIADFLSILVKYNDGEEGDRHVNKVPTISFSANFFIERRHSIKRQHFNKVQTFRCQHFHNMLTFL
jgi:hypothetical protein